jgi:hypothetical protein
MKYVLTIALMTIMMAVNGVCEITDVPKSDPAYPAIQRSVSSGYLPAYGNQFRPNEPISRKEVALMIDRMLSLLDRGPANLNDAEKQELGHLSKTYKQYLSTLELTVNDHTSRLGKAESEQETLRFDISKTQSDLQDRIDELKVENRKQHKFIILGIITAAIIGLLG